MDNGTTTKISQFTGETLRRKSIKIKDETGTIVLIIWNNKVKKNF